jgi:hypothetical protein
VEGSDNNKMTKYCQNNVKLFSEPDKSLWVLIGAGSRPDSLFFCWRLKFANTVQYIDIKEMVRYDPE